MTHGIPIEDATPAALAPFGALVGAAVGASRRTLFYEDAVELYETPRFVSDADTCLSVARVRPRPPQVVFLERRVVGRLQPLPLRPSTPERPQRRSRLVLCEQRGALGHRAKGARDRGAERRGDLP